MYVIIFSVVDVENGSSCQVAVKSSISVSRWRRAVLEHN